MSRPLAISLLLTLALSHSRGQIHIQTTTKYQTTTATTISLAFTAGTTAKDLIVVHLDWDNQAVSVSSVTDTRGDTYHLINGPTNWNGTSFRGALYYAYNIIGGTTTVTATLSGAPTSYSQIYISEFSGIDYTINPLDQNSVATGDAPAGNILISSGAKTTTASNELIYGAAIGAGGALKTGTGFTNRSTANQNIIESKNVAAIGSYSTTDTSLGTGGFWIAQMATFFTTTSVLPVTLSSFTAECRSNAVVLDWTTATETNNAYFTVEGSADGTNWNAVATLKGAGTTFVPQSYSYMVPANDDTLSYFRLKQTDLDGQSTYSRIVGTTGCQIATTGIKLFPNPSNGSSLSGTIVGRSGDTYVVQVFDNAGKVLRSGTVGQGAFQLGFPQPLPAGIYFARFVSNGSSTVTAFLVKH